MSFTYPIGFDFALDGVTYKSFVADTNGWMALVGPGTPFSLSQILEYTGPSSNGSTGYEDWDNSFILPVMASNTVLLCPWFSDLRNVHGSLYDDTSSTYSRQKEKRVGMGLEPMPSVVNELSPGVKYYNDNHSPAGGRRLIVRWHSLSSYNNAASGILKFEVVLYENGTIEFRYAPRTPLAVPVNSGERATIGIFMPNGTHRFRDFSSGLGYDDQRQQYVYGGYVYDASYNDGQSNANSWYDAGPSYTHPVPYAWNLKPYNNWPSVSTGGGTFTFSPPMNRRKVLPRNLIRKNDAMLKLPTVARTGDSRLGTGLVTFDDRRSPTYSSSSIVNYPSTLPRFFGGTGVGTLQRQDLFTNDFVAPGGTNSSAIDQFMNDGPVTLVDAFNETNRYEQDQATLSTNFFATGSSTTYLADGFTQNLKSKTQIKFTLNVDTSVTMPDITSSIYYYNNTTKAWEVPQNSSYIIGNLASGPPSPNPYAGGDWTDAAVDGMNWQIAEDMKGFGPIGNLVASGTLDRYGAYAQTDPQIGAVYDPKALPYAIGKSYAKSIRNNNDYVANNDETFTLPITSPFLIEKAVFEIPFAAGPGWFNDITQCFIPGNSAFYRSENPAATSFDFAGPALTVALFRQVPLDGTATGPGIRDLIMTGTITHTYDNTRGIMLASFAPADSTTQVWPVGFLSYAGPPGAVVTPNSTGHFTGSVTIESTALSSAGVIVKFITNFMASPEGAAATDLSNFLTSTPTLTLTTNGVLQTDGNGTQNVNIAYISPLGRGGTGFQQAGRCILGNEYVTLQGLSDPEGLVVPNPLYTPVLSDQQKQALDQVAFGDLDNIAKANVSAAIPLISHFPSPYLVMPGDKLVLSISKMRPVLYQPHDSSDNPTYNTAFSSSTQRPNAGHDVSLVPGQINITLYGSQVQEGVEFHDTLNQPLASDVVHEIIGAEPVLDQFEIMYRNELSGSFTDNAVFGSMSEEGRFRLLSWLNANNVPAGSAITDWPHVGTFHILSPELLGISNSKAYWLQQWWERAGDVRLSSFVNSSERFYDSMMPSIDTCLIADGNGIVLGNNIGNSQQLTTKNVGSVNLALTNTTSPSGTPNAIPNWSMAFPFEPRYANAARQLDISKGYIATQVYNADGTVSNISPTEVNGLIVGTYEQHEIYLLGTVGSLPVSTTVWSKLGMGVGASWFVDVNLAQGINSYGLYVTGSTSTDDTSRILYGYGDRNTVFADPYAESTLTGVKNWPDQRDVAFRDSIYVHGGAGPEPTNNLWFYSPVIRGWKYGVYSGIPTFSKCYWRRGKFGQFRDMLEQRLDTKYYESPENAPDDPDFVQGVKDACVNVKFISPDGRLTNPSNTWSNNQHFECTSSLPFFDGVITSRTPINVQTLNKRIISFNKDIFGNVAL